MRHLHRLITTTCLLISLNASASSVFVEPLYWQAREPYDWASVNNMNSTNHEATYKTLNFDFKPGIRFGGELGKDDFGTRASYTYYHTDNGAAVTGSSIASGLLGARIALLAVTNGVYTAEQAEFNINYNIVDWDVNQKYQITDSVMIRPSVGLRGGTIYQTLVTHLQGSISVKETAENNFKGIGPKVGIETKIDLHKAKDYNVYFFGSFTPAYLWGQWHLSDHLVHIVPSTSADIDIDIDNRDFGSLSLQGVLAIGVDYKNMSLSLNYELQDWYNQLQFFDNGTGGHDNDLYFHGLSLNFNMRL